MIPAVNLFVLPRPSLSLSVSSPHCHPTVPFDSPHERLQAPAATLHLPPDHPPFLHLHPFLVRLLPLGDTPLQRYPASLAGQDLYAGALCHQCVPGPHPPHPTDLWLLPTFPRLSLHAPASEGEEDPKRGDFQRGDGWRIQGWGEEGEQRGRQGGGARLWWWWQWVPRGANKVFPRVCLFMCRLIGKEKQHFQQSFYSHSKWVFFIFCRSTTYFFLFRANVESSIFSQSVCRVMF